jgi:hypothetical protein
VFVRVEKPIRGDKSWLMYTDQNLEINEDPGFVNEKEQDFTLKKSSVIFKKLPGFQSIPFGRIGRKSR